MLTELIIHKKYFTDSQVMLDVHLAINLIQVNCDKSECYENSACESNAKQKYKNVCTDKQKSKKD